MRLLTPVKVTVLHVGDMGPGIRAPRTHRVGVLLGVGFDRRRNAAVGVAFPKHGVYRGSKHPGIAGADFLFRVVPGFLREIRHVITMLLEFLDGGHELWNGRTDVGQLDYVCLRGGREFAQLCKGIRHSLLPGKLVREIGQDPAGQ